MATQSASTVANARLSTARSLMQRGAWSAARAELTQLLRREPNDPLLLHLASITLFQLGERAAAYRLLTEAFGIRPSAEAAGDLLEMYRSDPDADKAAVFGRHAVSQFPSSASVQHGLAMAYCRVGRLEAAVAAFDRAVALRPDWAQAICNRGNARLLSSDLVGAEGDFRRALVLQPELAEAHCNLGSCLRALRRFEEAIASLRAAEQLAPRDPRVAMNLCLVLCDLELQDEAADLLRRAVASGILRADDPLTLNLLGHVHLEAERIEEALQAFDAAIAQNPSFAEAHYNRGLAWKRAARYSSDPVRTKRALASFEQALAFNPRLADAHLNAGTMLRDLGKFDDALTHFDRAIAINPKFAGAFFQISTAKRFSAEDDPHLAAMRRLASREDATLARDDRIYLHFASGKAFDDLGRYDEAFAEFAAGNELCRIERGEDEAPFLEFFERIRAAFTAEVMDYRQSGDALPRPIFIFGMPRSGTTLVEQILASHPEVAPAGEQRHVGDIARRLAARRGSQKAFPEIVGEMIGQDFALAGAEYLHILTREFPGARYVTDKMPQNFFFAGLISLALPGARLIHVARNPVDTCLSGFMQHFEGRHSRSYDLAGLGRYYAAYHRLMTHWRTVLPAGAMLDVQYEDLVGDLEGSARRLLAHCGLRWHDNLLAFHRLERPVKTASVEQVRRPLYPSSVGRWRNYRAHLAPLLSALGELANDVST